jgi:S-DNA-T family DNA segregation ATPase FtsK/SpoIIIE|tara:strand:- start:3346 stop:5703 length:2358 start_codon:yes stop_codon:yes gene_type:complete
LKKLTKNKSNLFSKIFNPAFSLSTATKTLTLDLFNLFLVILGIVLLISLWTFEISDPNWKEISSSETNLTNSIGIVGAWLSSFLYEFLGITAWSMIILFFYPAFMSYLKNTEEKPAQKNYFFSIFGFFIFCSSLCLLIDLHINAFEFYFPETSSGILGTIISVNLYPYLSLVGSTLFGIFFLMVSFSLMINLSWKNTFIGLQDNFKNLVYVLDKYSKNGFEYLKKLRQKKQDQKNRQAFLDSHKEKIRSMPKPEIKKVDKPIVEGKKVHQEKQVELFEEKIPGEMPKISLLDEKKNDAQVMNSQQLYELDILKEALITKLAEFKITGPEGEYAIVRETMRGPVVTRFEVELPKGIKVSQVSNLNKDLARSLGVGSIRIVEVIEGRETIGIEVPNADREDVFLGEVIASKLFEESKSPLTLAYGKDIEGKPVLEDLASLPHLLIAGTTGSGKSVALNAMLMSILYKATPQQVRLVLIDPKMLELSVYEDLPHLLCPVITDMAQAAFGLRWCVNEMERRYKLMAAMSVRNLNGFNAKVKKANESGNPIKDPTFKIDEEKGTSEADIPNLQELPQIVIAVDELADLMMVVGKKVEQLIARLAQKARAAGIHMLLATQRPSVDVITGLIKANISARMAFNVASSMDSRVVLDQVGAEQLLGRGDMLYVGSGTSVPLRVHGAFVGEEEIIRVVKDWKDKETVSYLDAVTKAPETGEDSEGSEDSEKDEFYDQAVAFVVESRRASISAVQRKFRIGYNRAARLIEAMESAGLVSEMNSNGNREVLAPSNAE